MLFDPVVFLGIVPGRPLLALLLAAPLALAVALVPILVALPATRAAAPTSLGHCSLAVDQPLVRFQRVKRLPKIDVAGRYIINGLLR